MRKFIFLMLCGVILAGLAGMASGGSIAAGTPTPEAVDASRLEPERLMELQLQAPREMDAVQDEMEIRDEAQNSKVLFEPWWGPVVYQSYMENNWEIYRSDAYGTAGGRLTKNYNADIQPKLNRGATRIVYVCQLDGNYEICSMNLDGSDQMRLTSVGANDIHPDWSPDGQQIVFQSYRDGNSDLYVMNRDGSGVRRLTDNPAYDGEPAWSPDGTKIAFISARAGHYHLWVMNADGNEARLLSSEPYCGLPAWNPDSEWIGYESDANNNGWLELHVIHVSGGGNSVVLPDNAPGENTCVADDVSMGSWTPDGKGIVYTRATYYKDGNVWYLTRGQLNSVCVRGGCSVGAAQYGQRDFNPSMATRDSQPPVSQIAALPVVSASPVVLNWASLSGDVGGAGIKHYELQYRDGKNGTWQTYKSNLTTDGVSFSGIAGHVYYFRLRAVDWAYNIEAWPAGYDAATKIDDEAPVTSWDAWPEMAHGTQVHLSWHTKDPGGSEIQGYEWQYRDTTANSSWISLTQGVSPNARAYDFTGVIGKSYFFRIRATDKAGNVEDWKYAGGEKGIFFYNWKLAGQIFNSAGASVSQATIQAAPNWIRFDQGSRMGAYQGYVGETPGINVGVTWQKAGYGLLPSRLFNSYWNNFTYTYLPPMDNVVDDGGFENGENSMVWQRSADITPTVVETNHTGNFAMQLGSLPTVNFQQLNRGWDSLVGRQLDLQVDSHGVSHVVWGEDAGTVGGITISYGRKAPGEYWQFNHFCNVSNHDASLNAQQVVSLKLLISPLGEAYLMWSGIAADGHSRIGVIHGTDAYIVPQTAIYESAAAVGELPIEAVMDNNWFMHIVGQEAGNLIYLRRPLAGPTSPVMTLCQRDGKSVCSDPAIALEGVNALQLVYQKGGAIVEQRIDLSSLGITTTILAPAEAQGMGPQIGVDASGSAHTVWYATWPEPGLYYAGQNPQGSWSTPLLIARVTEPVQPLLQVQADGGVQVVWSDDVNVNYLHRDLQGQWNLPYVLNGDGMMTRDLDLSAAANGDLLISWSGLAVNDWDIYCAKIGPEGQVRFAGNCLEDGKDSYDAHLAMDANGALSLMWEQTSPTYFIGWEILNESTLSVTAQSAIQQQVTIPVTMTAPVLSFLYDYRSLENSAINSLTVELNDGMTTTEIFSTTAVKAGWTHQALSLAGEAGKSVTLTFALHQAAGKTPAALYLDEVSLGSVGANLVVTAPALRRVVPGEQVVYSLTYANQGGEVINGAVLTQTLPAELQFVAADPAPVSSTGSELIWNLNELPPLTEGRIVVTATVSPTATGWSRLTSTLSIAAPGITELETADNKVDWLFQVAGADQWAGVSGSSDCISRGTSVVYTMTTGNRSGVAARNSWLTMTLPLSLSLVAADPVPDAVTGTVLLWNLGTVAGNDSALHTVVVTVTTPPTLTWNQWLTTTVAVGDGSVEPHIVDNRGVISTFVGFLRFLPWISKPY